MAKKRTTRQLMIDMCKSNESECERIVGRLEAIMGTYSEDAPEHSLKAAEVLEVSRLNLDILHKFTLYVRGA